MSEGRGVDPPGATQESTPSPPMHACPEVQWLNGWWEVRDLAIDFCPFCGVALPFITIEPCEAPDCEKVVYRYGRRVYCSDRCRERMKKRRARTRNHEEEA